MKKYKNKKLQEIYVYMIKMFKEDCKQGRQHIKKIMDSHIIPACLIGDDASSGVAGVKVPFLRLSK